MNTRLVVLVVLGLVLGGIVAGVFYYFNVSNSSGSKSSQQLSAPSSPTPAEAILLVYENPSGFVFEYPEGLEVKEVEDEDAEYASILITSPDVDGIMTFKVTDTKSKSAEDWIEDNDISTKKADVSEIPFADIEASEVASSGGILTVSYDQGALFIIRVDWMDDEDFWQDVYDTILSTFAFTEPEADSAPSPPASSGGGSGDPGIIFEGEEIIE